MAGSEAAKSALEKPLSELTEEDIAQVTREDCRKFLKQKGMRRPSWNKSQAVQQVISLKALLEVCHDAEDEAPSADAVPSISPVFLKPPLQAAGQFPFATMTPNCAALPPREIVTAAAMEGQLTIFYEGQVKVYNRVPSEKAQVILQIAGDRSFHDLPPMSSPSPSPSRSFYSNQSPNCNMLSFDVPPAQSAGYLHIPQNSERLHQFREGNEEWRSHREVETEGPTSRAASVQRYLEKRKDRFKCKKPTDAGQSHMELLLGQRMSQIYASAVAPRNSLRISIDLNDSC